MILRKLVNRSLKMDLDYDYLTVTASSEVRGFDNYQKVVRWWLENQEPSQDFWVKTPISDISNRKLSELKGLVPALGDLRRDFQTFIRIYGILEQTNERWDPNKVGEINTLVEQWHNPHGARTLKTFWSDAGPTVSNMQFWQDMPNVLKLVLNIFWKKHV